MKNFFYLVSLFSLLTSCNSVGRGDKYIAESVGNPYEIFVVAPISVYRGELGDSLKTVLRTEVNMINYSEPSFDLYNLPPDGFRGVNVNHRNLIFLQMGPKFPVAKSFTLRDKYSKPQLITVLEAPDSSSMLRLIMEERFKIKYAIEKEELERFAMRASKRVDKKLTQQVDDMFNILLKIPTGYKLRNTVGDDFMWLSLELPESSQGLLIYEYPYDGDVLTDSMIIEARNKFVANVPGELPGGYMTTGQVFDPETVAVMMQGNEWYETRGFWRVENDFQGGPFVSFSRIDNKAKRVVVVDCYVYSPNPNKKQRNFLKQLEGIAHTAVIK